MLKSISIFLSENNSLDQVLEIFSNTLNAEKFKKELSKVFAKIYNNYVGYYLFRDSETYYKIFILPKHIKEPRNDSDDEKRAIDEFIGYLREYYRLKSKYPEYNKRALNIESYKEIVFELQNNHSIQSIEQLIFCKYQSILKRIEAFFMRHKSYRREVKSYISQGVKYRINLQRNIREPDKTKIHQDKIEDIVYSEMATIAYGALKLFIHKKIDLIDNEKDKKELIALVESIQNILLKRFHVDASFSLSAGKLISNRSSKYFHKKIESIILYTDLLSLFGLEHFYNEDQKGDVYQSEKAEALFIRPEDLFEWYVYDWIQYDFARTQFVFGIKPEKVVMKWSKKYYLKTDRENIDKTSNPDIIIEDKEKNKVVVDVKWKVIEKINDISDSDILKIERDYKVHGAINAFLVYQDACDANNKKIVMKYGMETFSFAVVGIKI